MLDLLPQLGIAAADLAAAFLFLYGLHRMSSPVTAPSGIFVAGIGMAVAVLASFLYAFDVGSAARPDLIVNIALALVALALGGGVAWWSGRTVAMTAMPQMVAIYNGMGGGAAGAIAAVELYGDKAQGMTALGVTLLGALIGAVSLSGSLIAWAKLDGVINKPVRVKGQQVFNGLVLLATIVVGGSIVGAGQDGSGLLALLTKPGWITVFFGCALALGILMTLPIGGADMPVVISIFNAFTGLAVGLEGFVLQNPALMIAGMVVGAAGMLLTLLMAKAMNRSVSNVIFTNFGDAPKHKQGAIKGSLKPMAPGDAGIAMRYAASVIIVPGYGLAVAQAQGKLFEFVKLLQAGGVSVKFAAPGRGAHARPDGRAAGRSRGALRPDLPARGHQRPVRQHRHRARDRRQRRGQPGRAHGQVLADLRHAHPQRRPGQEGLRRQARRRQGVRRHRQRAVLRRQLQHGLRRCPGRADLDDRSGARPRPARGRVTFTPTRRLS